jgi:hypothetical protein
MKFQFFYSNRRSLTGGIVRFNLFQLSLLSTLFLNLVMTGSTTASASETTITESASQPPLRSLQAELNPTVATDTPSLEIASDPLPMVTEDTSAIGNSPNSTPTIPAIDPAVTPTPILEVEPATQTISTPTISTQASDLLGVDVPQQIQPETLAQTESTPADGAPESKPVNNPLIPPPGWRFDFEPYLFLPLDVQGDIFFGRGRDLLFPNRPGGSLGGILGGRGVSLNVNARLSDIRANLTNLFGISGRFQVWNGNFGIVSEGLYVNSGFQSSSDGGTLTFRDRFNVPIPGFQIDTRNTLASFSLGASYRFLTVPFRTITDPADARQYYPAISFEALAGFRYLSVFQSIEFERGPSFEFSGSEVNPMLGGTVKLMLSDKFAFFFRGDTSNLGGGNLKQYYNLHAGVDWKFSGSFAVRLAYRFNQIEFVEQGRLQGDNGLNLRSQGVQLGISWQF